MHERSQFLINTVSPIADLYDAVIHPLRREGLPKGHLTPAQHVTAAVTRLDPLITLAVDGFTFEKFDSERTMAALKLLWPDYDHTLRCYNTDVVSVDTWNGTGIGLEFSGWIPYKLRLLEENKSRWYPVINPLTHAVMLGARKRFDFPQMNDERRDSTWTRDTATKNVVEGVAWALERIVTQDYRTADALLAVCELMPTGIPLRGVTEYKNTTDWQFLGHFPRE